MKTARLKICVLDALNPEYHRPEKRSKRGVITQEELHGRLHMTTPELVQWCNQRMRHGTTTQQLGNVLSKLLVPDVIKMSMDTPKAGVLSGSYGVSSWCLRTNLIEAMEDLNGGPDLTWTSAATIKGQVCAVRRVCNRWLSACGETIKNILIEDQCSRALVSCPACSHRWEQQSNS